MSKFTTNSNNRGFTLVELLIVIVIIAILAAISIVAYNGIQQRARDSAAAEAASQLSTKVEAWNSIVGTYPTDTQVRSENLATVPTTVDDDLTEAKIDPALADKISDNATASATSPVVYTMCTGGTGATIEYNKGAGTETITRGTGC